MTSTNWAGYVINSNGITAISASWTIPEIQCTGGATQSVSAAVAVWIGIDGLGTAIPEQVGTNGVCLNGAPIYVAWEEDPSLASRGARSAFGNELSAGDHITSFISFLGKSEFQLSIKDTTTGDSHTFTIMIPNTARASAEWIVEAPSTTVAMTLLTMPKFSPVTFSDCSAAVNNVSGSILQNNAQSWSMVDSNGNILVAPQGLNQAGTSFQVDEVA